MDLSFFPGAHFHQLCPVRRLNVQSWLPRKGPEQSIQHERTMCLLRLSLSGKVNVRIQHYVSLLRVVIQGERPHSEPHPKTSEPKHNDKWDRDEYELPDLRNRCRNGCGVGVLTCAQLSCDFLKVSRYLAVKVDHCDCGADQQGECAKQADPESLFACTCPVAPKYADLLEDEILTNSILKVRNRSCRCGNLRLASRYLCRYIFHSFSEFGNDAILLFRQIVSCLFDLFGEFSGVYKRSLPLNAPISRLSRQGVAREIVKEDWIDLNYRNQIYSLSRKSEFSDDGTDAEPAKFGGSLFRWKLQNRQILFGYCQMRNELGAVFGGTEFGNAFNREAADMALGCLQSSSEAFTGTVAIAKSGKISSFYFMTTAFSDMKSVSPFEAFAISTKSVGPERAKVVCHSSPQATLSDVLP